jgi:hypothetical protein
MGYHSRRLHDPDHEPGLFLSREKPIRFERLIYLALSQELISINQAAYFSGTSVWHFREQLDPGMKLIITDAKVFFDLIGIEALP